MSDNMEKTGLTNKSAGNMEEVVKYGNLITNLFKLNVERNLELPKQQLFEDVNHQETDNCGLLKSEDLNSEDCDSRLIICYEPLFEDEEEDVMKTTFKLLDKFFQSSPDLLNELMTINDHKPTKVYKTYLRKCRICQRAYTNQKDLDEHKEMHFEMDRSFRCKVCRKLFFDIRNLKNHEKGHARENSKCKICLKEFRLKKYLDEHMEKHHQVESMKKKEYNEDMEDDEDEITYPCDQCGKVFRNRSKLMTHANMHFGYKPYKCKKCPKAFSKQGNLRIHLASHRNYPMIHRTPDILTRGTTFPCGDCGKMFRSESNLIDHTRIHAGFKPYECKQCHKAFKLKETLQNHMVNHKKEVIKLYKCDLCPQQFYYLRRITDHMEQAHPKVFPYRCEDCCEKFSRKESLKIHLSSHAIDLDVPACSICNKSFQSNFNMRRHKNMFHDVEENPIDPAS